MHKLENGMIQPFVMIQVRHEESHNSIALGQYINLLSLDELLSSCFFVQN
jgi:hypothetical protein